MTARTWIGGGNDKASNPHDWSPTGVPRPSDTISMNGGTIKIHGNDLASPDIGGLAVSGDATIDVSRHAFIANAITIDPTPVGLGDPSHVDINVKGVDTFSLRIGDGLGSETVNLIGNARWIGGFTAETHRGAAPLTVNGGPHAAFVNTGTSIAEFTGLTFLNVDVTGCGTFETLGGSTLEFGKSVGAGQTVILENGLGGSTVQIDQPNKFLGAVQLDLGAVDLVGLARADSYSYQNDILSIFGGKKILDTLRLTTGSAFNVEKTAGGVTIYTASLPNPVPTGTSLPLHT